MPTQRSTRERQPNIVSITATNQGSERDLNEPDVAPVAASQVGKESRLRRWIGLFLTFFKKPWWKILLWMLLFCSLLLVTVLVAPHLSTLLTDRLTWAGLEKWATSSFATAAGAVAAAAIAGSAVVATLNQNRRAEASKTWWETFEWAAERAIPSKKENIDQALPFGVSLAILSPLLDDDLAGRRPNKSEQKSWALRKQACESLIGVLREPYEKEISEAETRANEADLQPSLRTTEPRLPDEKATEAAPAAKVDSQQDTDRRAPDRAPVRRPTLTRNDVTSVMNFLDAHPESEQARQLANIHYGSLIARSLESILRIDRNLNVDERLTVLTKDEDIQVHLSGMNPRPRGIPDALVVRGKRTLWVEAKSLRRIAPDRISRIITNERSSAKRLWEAAQVPTLFIHDLSRPDEVDNEGIFSTVSTGLGLDADRRRIRRAILKLMDRNGYQP